MFHVLKNNNKERIEHSKNNNAEAENKNSYETCLG